MDDERVDRGEAPPSELSRLLSASDPASRESAWESFTKAYSRLLLRTARSANTPHDQGMDRYTYVLEQLREDDFRRLRTYVADGRGKFSTWLVVVARRLCLDYDRQRYGRRRASGPSSESGTGAIRRRLVDLVADEIDVAALPAPASGNPEAELRASELRRALASALEHLEPRDRLLLQLRFEEDLSVRQVAAAMGFPTPFHVYRRLNSVLDTLRFSLRRSGIEEATP